MLARSLTAAARRVAFPAAVGAIAAAGASCAPSRASSAMPPFHLAIPVNNLDDAKAFYGGVMGLSEGRSSAKWQDYSLFGHQLVVHWVGEDYMVRPFPDECPPQCRRARS